MTKDICEHTYSKAGEDASGLSTSKWFQWEEDNLSDEEAPKYDRTAHAYNLVPTD